MVHSTPSRTTHSRIGLSLSLRRMRQYIERRCGRVTAGKATWSSLIAVVETVMAIIAARAAKASIARQSMTVSVKDMQMALGSLVNDTNKTYANLLGSVGLGGCVRVAGTGVYVPRAPKRKSPTKTKEQSGAALVAPPSPVATAADTGVPIGA